MKFLKLLILLFCLTTAFTVSAQQPTPVFNQVSKEELNMKSYDEDPEAEAVVLFDKGETRFIETDNGYKMRFVRHKRVKILDKKGEQHSKVSIFLRHENKYRTEEITSLRAYTYNLVNGEVEGKKVPEAQIYEESYEDRLKRKTFTFPDVQAGSVLEYEYVLESPFFFFLPDWEFQESIPVLYSEYVVRTIPFYEYIFISQGIDEFDFYDSKLAEKTRKYPGISVTDDFGRKAEFKEVITTYVMKNQPAFRDESYITSRNHYIKKVDFQLSKVHSPYSGTTEYMTTWPKLAEDLLDDEKFGKYLKNSESQGKKALKTGLLADQKVSTGNVRKLIRHVKENYNWNGRSRIQALNTSRQFLDRKEGNTAEINLYLCGLLRAAGFQADPVILSTRNHGKVYEKYPFIHYFNTIVVLVSFEGHTFLADATDPLVPTDRIPVSCINEYGLVVKEDGIGWVNLSENSSAVTTYSSSMQIDPENLEATSLVSMSATSLDAYGHRKLIGDDKDKLVEFFLDNGFSSVETTRFIGAGNIEKPFMMAGKCTTELEVIGDRIIVSPFAGFPLDKNPLKKEKRHYPIDFIYPKTRKFISIISLPDGYASEDVPENVVISDDLVDVSLNYAVSESRISITGHYQFKKAIYPVRDMERLREHFETIISNFNRSLILKMSDTD